MMKRVVILALTTLCLCLALSAPARAQVSADFCGDLEGIAEGWRNLFPLGDPAACPDLCRAWVQSCRGAVSAAKRCTLAIFEEIGTVASAQCTTGATGAERAQCHRTSRAEIDALKAAATAQAEMGFSFCADAQQAGDCLATCQSTE